MKAWYLLMSASLILSFVDVGCTTKQVGSTSEIYAWNRTDKYVPPDFEAFFPDDIVAGKQLDKLFPSLSESSLPDKEIFNIVRRGLRRTTKHRTLILRAIGNRYIWGKKLQHSDAIEIMYHAADPEDKYGTRHYAVYFGLSIIQPRKAENVLKTLVTICMRGHDIGRIAWGCRNQLDELHGYLKPYLESSDPQIRDRALEFENKWKSEIMSHSHWIYRYCFRFAQQSGEPSCSLPVT